MESIWEAWTQKDGQRNEKETSEFATLFDKMPQ